MADPVDNWLSSSDPGWLVLYGIPALVIGTGITLLTIAPSTFWWGEGVAAFGCLWLAYDWIRAHLGRTFLVRFGRPILGLAVGLGTLFYFAFRPAPLTALMFTDPSPFDAGTTVYGMTWQREYFPLHVILNNDTSMEYDNVDAYVSTDLMIANGGQQENINHCAITAEGPGIHAIGSVTFVDRGGTRHTVPLTFSGPGSANRVNRVRCDKVAPHSSVELLFAAISTLVPDEKASPVRPAWSVFDATYEAGNRYERAFQTQCFAKACGFIPRSPRDIGDVR